MAPRIGHRRWIVVREGTRSRWGGDLRRRHLFSALARRTDAAVVESWTSQALVTAARGHRWRGPLRRVTTPPGLASTEQLSERLIASARRWTDPIAVGIYDDAIAQSAALGIRLDPDRAIEIRRRSELNRATFRWQVVPTASFADLAGLDPPRVIVGGNATDASHVRPGPWPSVPAVGTISGAAPGRGLESLIEAVRLLRTQVRDLRLLLWLVATSEESGAYLANLRSDVERDPWIEVAEAPYAQLSDQLRRATVLCIPHPASPYMDVALPVKLFDSMAAGRPLVVTPRTETRALVERYGVGLVTGGDRPDDLAESLRRLIEDEALGRRLGSAARTAAESVFDWPIVGGRIADEILRREGVVSRPGGTQDAGR